MSSHSQSTRSSAGRLPSSSGAALPRRPSTGNIAPSQSSEGMRRSSNVSMPSGSRPSVTHSSGMRSGSGGAAPQSSMSSAMQGTRRPVNSSTTPIPSSPARPSVAGANSVSLLQKVPSSSSLNRVGSARPVGSVPSASNGVSKPINFSEGHKSIPYNNTAAAPPGAGVRSATTNPNNLAKTGAPVNPSVGSATNPPANAPQTMSNGMRPDLSMGGQPSVGDMIGRSNSLYGNSMSRNNSFSGSSVNKDMYGGQSAYGLMGVPNPAANGVYMMPNNQGSAYGGFGQG